MTALLVWAQLVSTLYLVGLIWVIQVVHYPLMDSVSPDAFGDFHRRHSRRIGWIVIGPMIVELAAASALVVAPPPGVSRLLCVAGLALLAIVWVSTFTLQVPMHRRLAAGFDAEALRSLVRGNWIRTVAWSLRGAIAVAITTAAV